MITMQSEEYSVYDIESNGGVLRRGTGVKHRLDRSFLFSGGVFSERAPSAGGKWE